MQISYFVAGVPKPQARPRMFRRGSFVSTYSPKTKWFSDVVKASKEKKQLMKECGLNQFVKEIALELVFNMPIPKNTSKKKRAMLKFVTKKPDIDNLAKAVMDAIGKVEIWRDDSQIAILKASKVYSDNVGCQIVISEILEGE